MSLKMAKIAHNQSLNPWCFARLQRHHTRMHLTEHLSLITSIMVVVEGNGRRNVTWRKVLPLTHTAPRRSLALSRTMSTRLFSLCPDWISSHGSLLYLKFGISTSTSFFLPILFTLIGSKSLRNLSLPYMFDALVRLLALELGCGAWLRWY